jgi:DNA adenine methylase
MTTLVLTPPAPRRLIHFTPLRYPGGKGKMAAYIKSLIKVNRLLDGEYVEPYAGGAAIALELLFHEYVSRVHINDISKPVFAFWKSVLNSTNELCKRVRDTALTIESRDRQKIIFANQDEFEDIDVGFAAFFLNRVNRSGILNGGAIGGRDQTGPWKIDARYNREELVFRIESIAKMRDRIRLSQMDALKFLKAMHEEWSAKTLLYLDPPYYQKGRELYYDYYRPADHEKVRDFIAEHLSDRFWLVSYDDAPAIRELYQGYRWRAYKIGYSARETREGAEVMFFSDTLRISPLVGPVTVIGGSHMGEQDDQYASPTPLRRVPNLT